MLYKAYFKDIQNTYYNVEIRTPEYPNSQMEITLTGDPVTITQDEGDLFAPIKARSCTINILTDGGLYDLYTCDPQGVSVKIYQRNNTNNVLFWGYATPMNYGQDWTFKDTLTLECVDMVSSLKEIPYVQMGNVKSFIPADELISYCLSKFTPDSDDTINTWMRWYWPQVGYIGLNQQDKNGANPLYSFNNTADFLHSISFSEANFFDDDDEKTPWTFYQVLEEICRFFCVSLVPYKKGVMFIDYLYAGSTYGTYACWEFDLDLNRQSWDTTKNVTWQPSEYAAGTASIEMDDFYNVIAENTNRYNIEQVCTDVMDHKKWHVSITKEKNFGSGYQVWTHTIEHFFTDDEITHKYAFKTFCYADVLSNWRHVYYRPSSFYNVNPTMFFANNGYFDGDTYDLEMQNPHALGFYNIPENKWINTIGATFLHYATMEDANNKPTKLDWTDVIMFQCAHPTMRTHGTLQNGTGKFKYSDMFGLTGIERPVLYYEGDEEICLSPKEGKSWLVINCKLWYQQNKVDGKKTLKVTKTYAADKENKQTMFPIEDVTDWEPYRGNYIHDMYADPPAYTAFWRGTQDPNYGNGWQLLRVGVKVGDKYWNGTQWTTTQSTFYLNFTSEYKEKKTVYDAFQYLTWMNCVSNSDYEDKVGKEGYCIPINPSDAVKGTVEIYLYTPRMIPADGYNSSWGNDEINWYALGPIIFMKDLKIDYVYTDTKEWYLNEDLENDDVKYKNDATKDNYKYEKEETLKIQSWQKDRPIAKSYPIVDINNQSYVRHEYVQMIYDQFYRYPREQEYNIIDRKLRHYKEPRLIYNANRHGWVDPWDKITLADSSDINNTCKFVVQAQEFDVRNRNNRVKLIEWGDGTP